MVAITTEERRARLAVRHHLTPESRGTDVAAVAHDLVGIHATDPVSVYLGLYARLRHPTAAAVEKALYDDRTVARVVGMRRTMFVVPREMVPVIHHGAALAIARNERKRTVDMAEAGGVAPPGEGEEWVRTAEAATLAALDKRGEATAAELTKDVPALAAKLTFGEGKKWAGQVGMSTRLLFLLAAEGRIIRGRPRGSWVSSLYRWAPTATWLGGEIADLPLAAARAELVRRYLAAFGPVTLDDLKWWTGWPARDANAALADIDPAPVEVGLDGGDRGWVATGDTRSTTPPGSWVALLPALDTTTMGWADRAWYLGEHRSNLFDTNGNAGPTVWVDGRVVGGWAQRPSGEIVTRLLEKVGRRAERAIDDEVARLRDLIGDGRYTPRFRTPTERELLIG